MANDQVRKRAIFVDGASAGGATKAALGIAFYNFRGLYNVLVNKIRIGEICPLAFPPIITLHPDKLIDARPRGIAKDLAGAGFDIIPVASDGGADDKAIINQIRLLDPGEIGEVVVLTADKDFVPILQYKVSEGITVFWVSTERVDPKSGARCLSSDVLALCKSKVFTFFELGKFSGEICEKRRSVCSVSEARPRNDNFTKITVELRSTDRMEHVRLAGEMRQLKAHFPGLTFKINE